MKKLPLLLLTAGLATTAACQQDTKNTERKIDDLTKAVAALDQKVSAIQAGMGRMGQAPAQPQRRPEPDPNDVYAVPVDGDPFVGPADALVTIVKGSDYACPYCDKARETEDQLLKDYDGKLRIVYKQFVVHPQVATLPAQAACAATKQGHFKEMNQLLWEKGFAQHKFDEDTITSFAQEIHTADPNFNVDKFKSDMKGDCVAFVQKDQAELAAVGQGATPTFYINGRYVVGVIPMAQFKALIDEELKKAQDRVAQGTAPADYYKTWIVDKGLKKFTPKPTAPTPTAPAQPGAQPQPQVLQVKPAAPPTGGAQPTPTAPAPTKPATP